MDSFQVVVSVLANFVAPIVQCVFVALIWNVLRKKS